MGKFALDLKKFAEATESSLDEAHQAVVLELFIGVVLDTPVDTGQARANWLPSRGTPVTNIIPWTGGVSGATSMATTAIKATAARSKAGEITYLSNNLPYIVPLERGHSMQAPSGMVRRNLNRVRVNVGNIIKGKSKK